MSLLQGTPTQETPESCKPPRPSWPRQAALTYQPHHPRTLLRWVVRATAEASGPAEGETGQPRGWEQLPCNAPRACGRTLSAGTMSPPCSPSPSCHLRCPQPHPGAAGRGGTPAGRMAACWSSAPPSRCALSTCWPWPTCWCASQSSRPHPRTG